MTSEVVMNIDAVVVFNTIRTDTALTQYYPLTLTHTHTQSLHTSTLTYIATRTYSPRPLLSRPNTLVVVSWTSIEARLHLPTSELVTYMLQNWSTKRGHDHGTSE